MKKARGALRASRAWNEDYGDYIFAFTSRSGNRVVKRWREEVAKLNRVGPRATSGTTLIGGKRRKGSRWS